MKTGFLVPADEALRPDDPAALGALPAGVAHEINSPLAAVMTNIDAALDALAACHERSADLDRALEALRDAAEAGARVQQLVHDFGSLSRAAAGTRGPVDVHRVIESTLRITWTQIRDRARLVKSYADVPPVRANESRLGQVVLNLIVNAAQSIERGRADENQIGVTTGLEPDGRVFIEVADSGHGMSRDIQQRIFTPFFTTKPAGVGMGLGLSICQRLIASFGGEITVDSEPGRGSRFRVVVPAASSPGVTPALQRKHAPSARRRGRVLFIDDERALGRALQRTLSHEHDVLAVTSAREALTLLAHAEHFDLVLCDLTMPEMDGREFFDELSRRSPEEARRVVFLTGGVTSHEARAFLDRVDNDCLKKPVELDHLRSLISERVAG